MERRGSMKKFEISFAVGNGNTCMVFSVNYRSPLEFINEIELELRSTPLCRKVVFDLLLSNGATSNRYFEAYFNGNSLIDIKKCDNVAIEIKEASSCFYEKHPALLENSVLVSQQKFLVRSGCRL